MSNINSLLIVFLAILPPLLLFFSAAKDKKHPLQSPLRILAWVFVFLYSLKSIYLAYAIPYSLPFRNEFAAQYILYGQSVVLLGVIFFIFGFYSVLRKRLKLVRIKFSSFGRFLGLCYWPLFLFSLMLMIVYFFLKGFHLQLLSFQFSSVKYFVDGVTGQRNALGYLLIGSDILIVYFLYHFAYAKSLFKPITYIFSILFVAFNYLLSSQRTGILLIILGIILVSKISFFKLTSKKSLAGLLLVSMVITAVSISGYIRSERAAINISDINLGEAIATTSVHAFQGSYAMDPSKLAAITLQSNDLLMGQSFIMFALAPVPRLLWPDKPPVRLGPYIAQELLGYGNKSGAPPSAIGEFFVNFGWLGVVFGMFLFGVFVSFYRNSISIYFYEQHRVDYALFCIVIINFVACDFSFAVLSAIKYFIASRVCRARYFPL